MKDDSTNLNEKLQNDKDFKIESKIKSIRKEQNKWKNK